MTGTRAHSVQLAALWLGGAIAFFAAEGIAAAAVTPPYEYSYARDYISQLCVPGWTRFAAVMNAGLCVQGALFVVGALVAVRLGTTGRRRLFLILACLYGAGVIVVGAVPIGPGEPAVNLTLFHRTGATLAMFGGNAAILAGSSVVAGLIGVSWYRKASVVLAILGILSFVILNQPAAQPTLGVWERGTVYTTMVWQILSAVLLLTRRSEAIRHGLPRWH